MVGRYRIRAWLERWARAAGALLLPPEAVSQTPEGLTGFVLRVGSENPKGIARARRALLGLGARSAFDGRHSERRSGSRTRLLCNSHKAKAVAGSTRQPQWTVGVA